MILLATGVATLKQDRDRVLLYVPSGEDTLQVSLTVHQALGLAHTMPKALNGALTAEPIHGMSADIIKLPRPKHRKRK